MRAAETQSRHTAQCAVCRDIVWRHAVAATSDEAGDGPPVGYIAHVNGLYMLCFNYSYNEPALVYRVQLARAVSIWYTIVPVSSRLTTLLF